MTQIIGDRNRKSRFDPNLAERVNKEVEAEERRERIERLKREKTGLPPAPEPNIPLVVTEPSVIIPLGDYITLTDIVCKDADGKPFEQYAQLQFAKDVSQNQDGTHVSKTIYDWIVNYEAQKSFLPSFALLCNIAVKLYDAALTENTDGTFAVKDDELAQVLARFNKYAKVNHGWHACNTLVEYQTGQIIHYPHKEDFTSSGGDKDINLAQDRKVFRFNRKNLGDSALLETVLAEKGERLIFAKNLSGLEEMGLQKLCKIGKYFGCPAKLWCTPNKDETRGCWLGGSDIYGGFLLYADVYLVNTNASRGVRRSSS